MLMNSAEEDAAIAAALAASTNEPPQSTSSRTATGSAAPSGKGRGRGRGERSAAVVVSDVANDTCTKEGGSLLEGFHFLAIEENAEHALHALRPVFVVMYDVDLAWVRLLEVYKAHYPQRPLKVQS
jgi:hypothetical protein